ncbi:MAG: twin-arginine translocation signal domain-containing protein, partial [Nitrososphaerota archaeon]
MSGVSRRDFMRVVSATAAVSAIGSLIAAPRDALLSLQTDVLQARSDYRFVEDSWVTSTCL